MLSANPRRPGAAVAPPDARRGQQPHANQRSGEGVQLVFAAGELAARLCCASRPMPAPHASSCRCVSWPHASRLLRELLGFAAVQPVPCPARRGRKGRFVLCIDGLETRVKHMVKVLLRRERKNHDFREITSFSGNNGEGTGRRSLGAGEDRDARCLRL